MRRAKKNKRVWRRFVKPDKLDRNIYNCLLLEFHVHPIKTNTELQMQCEKKKRGGVVGGGGRAEEGKRSVEMKNKMEAGFKNEKKKMRCVVCVVCISTIK